MGQVMQRETLEENLRQVGPCPLGWLFHVWCLGGLAALTGLIPWPHLRMSASLPSLYHILNLEGLCWGLSLVDTICLGRSFPKYYIPVWLSKNTVHANDLYYCGGSYLNGLVWGKEV